MRCLSTRFGWPLCQYNMVMWSVIRCLKSGTSLLDHILEVLHSVDTDFWGIYYWIFLSCRLRAAKVEDFVTALRDLHHQFQWPFPLLSLSAYQQLKKKTCMSSHNTLDMCSSLDYYSIVYSHLGATVAHSVKYSAFSCVVSHCLVLSLTVARRFSSSSLFEFCSRKGVVPFWWPECFHLGSSFTISHRGLIA